MSSSLPSANKLEAESPQSLSAAIIGVICCVLIALTFLLPWYEGEYSMNGSRVYQDEYGFGDFTRELTGTKTTLKYSTEMERVGDLMSKVTIVLALSLAASIVATVLSFLHRRASGVVIGMASAGLLLAAGGIFYFGIIDALNLDSFIGLTDFNRTWAVEARPMMGWLLTVTVPAVQSAQAVVLAYSSRDD
jgi:hypothetical protein